MAAPTISEQVAAAFVGGFLGALLGVVLAWLFGVFSNTLGAGQLPVSFPEWALGGAAFFGGVGALFGSSVGTLLGNVIAAMFAFEGAEDTHVPGWLVLVVFLAAVGLVLWFTTGST